VQIVGQFLYIQFKDLGEGEKEQTNGKIIDMASCERSECSVRVNNNQCYQRINATSAEILCEHGEVPSSESLKKVEPEVLKKDLAELIHILYTAERPTLKEVIWTEIELILAKIESLKNIAKEQFETKVSWTKVAIMKHKECNYKVQRVGDAFPVISNHYNLLYNDSKSEDTPVSTDRLRVLSPKHWKEDKMKQNRKVMEKKTE